MTEDKHFVGLAVFWVADSNGIYCDTQIASFESCLCAMTHDARSVYIIDSARLVTTAPQTLLFACSCLGQESPKCTRHLCTANKGLRML